MPISSKGFVMVVANWRAGSADTSSIVVSIRSSFLPYFAQANLVSQTLLIASLMRVGGTFAAPTRRPFSTVWIRRRLCLAWGVDGAEGAWVVVMPGAGFCFLLLVGTSLKPVVSTPVEVIAAQVCFVAWAAGVMLDICWAGRGVGSGLEWGWLLGQGGKGSGWAGDGGKIDGEWGGRSLCSDLYGGQDPFLHLLHLCFHAVF